MLVIKYISTRITRGPTGSLLGHSIPGSQPWTSVIHTGLSDTVLVLILKDKLHTTFFHSVRVQVS